MAVVSAEVDSMGAGAAAIVSLLMGKVHIPSKKERCKHVTYRN
jgi:hypothetical protein